MPPMISDDEMSDSGPENIPAKGKIPTKEDEVAAAAEEEGEEEEDVDEYRVEKVLKHRFDGGALEYQIKWLGYDKKQDLTWEPIDNLENASEALDEYHKKIGGPPEAPASTKKGKGGKRSASAAFDSPAVEASGKKRGRKSEVNGTPSGKAELPAGSWETEIQRVTSILEEDEVKGKGGKLLIGLVEWVDGRKTQHKMDVLRRKCPQKLLNYYEQHLVFRNDGPAKEDE